MSEQAMLPQLKPGDRVRFVAPSQYAGQMGVVKEHLYSLGDLYDVQVGDELYLTHRNNLVLLDATGRVRR